jgi:hypothetical protein
MVVVMVVYDVSKGRVDDLDRGGNDLVGMVFGFVRAAGEE